MNDNERKDLHQSMISQEAFSDEGSHSHSGSDESSSGSEDEAPRPMVRAQAIVVRGPKRPNLHDYFATYKMEPQTEIHLCRTYANWQNAEQMANGTVPAPRRRAAQATPGKRRAGPPTRVSWAHGGSYMKKARDNDEPDFDE